MADLQEVHIERERWAAVLRALEPDPTYPDDDDGAE
jgi:hypothetical protein